MELEQILYDDGFRFDIEDNLWYDENENRKRYGFRIGIKYTYAKEVHSFELFHGSYSTNLGNHKDLESLSKAMFDYNGSVLASLISYKRNKVINSIIG
jgi:hypothetical protein